MFKILILFLLAINLLADESWENAIPNADNFDWVQTRSGEWLKGEIKGMYDRELEFDSDEFDIQFIDWKDVKQLISRGTTSLNIEGKGTLTGKLYVHDGIIVLSTQDESIELKRGSIISLTNGADVETSYWSGKLSFGLTLSSGNTDKTEYTAQFRTKRQTSDTRFQLDYIGNYSKTNEVETENNQRLSSAIDIFETRKFFWRPAFIEFYKDTFQNIDNKFTYGAGMGYDIYANNKINWTVFGGPAYQSTTFDEVVDEDEKTVTTPAFILTSDYDIELTRNIDFILKYQAYFVNKTSGTYVHHAIATLETELINDFNLDLSLMWDRVQDPTEGVDESGEPYLPQRDDYKTIISVGYSF